jgi:hypothetical protein
METLKFDEKNQGGINITTIKVIDVSTLSSMPDAINGVITSSVGADGDWEDFPLREQNCEMQELELTAGGAMYSVNFTANVMKQNAAKTQLLYELSKKRLLIDFTDMNGARRLAGTMDEGLRMSIVRMDTRRQFKEGNEYQLLFKAVRRFPVAYYTPA